MNGRRRLMFVGSIIRENPPGLVGDASLLEFYSAFEFGNGGLLVDCWQRATVVAKNRETTLKGEIMSKNKCGLTRDHCAWNFIDEYVNAGRF